MFPSFIPKTIQKNYRSLRYRASVNLTKAPINSAYGTFK